MPEDAAQQVRIEPHGIVGLLNVNHDGMTGQRGARFLHDMLEKGAGMLKYDSHLNDVSIDLSHLHCLANQRVKPRTLLIDNGGQVLAAGIVEPFPLQKCGGGGADRRERSAKVVRK